MCNVYCGQQKPYLRHKKEGTKRIGRPAGNSESWDDSEKCRGWYTIEELWGASMLNLQVQFWKTPSLRNCRTEDWLKTRHRASTSMYSQTFCICVMLPECHQWKPAVQAAAVTLRTPPVDGLSPASQPRNFENAPVTRQSAGSSARRPRRAFALCCHIAGWMQACN